MAEANRTDARKALDRLASGDATDPAVANDVEVLRAVLDSAGAVILFGNPEGTDLEAETPIEDWALDALASALTGRSGEARALIERYQHAFWDAADDEYGEGAPCGYRSAYRASDGDGTAVA